MRVTDEFYAGDIRYVSIISAAEEFGFVPTSLLVWSAKECFVQSFIMESGLSIHIRLPTTSRRSTRESVNVREGRPDNKSAQYMSPSNAEKPRIL
jgi:hypothetical protein